MRPGSMNGQGHVTKARSDMTLEELHTAYDALLLDKMQVVDQKDRLFDQLKEARVLIAEHESTIDTLQGRLDLLTRPESNESPFLEGVSIEGPPHIFDGAPEWSCGAWRWEDEANGDTPAGYSWMRRDDCPAHR